MTYRINLRKHDILVYLEANPLCTIGEIASALHYTTGQVRKVLVTLYCHGLVGRQSSLGLDSQRGRTGAWRWKSARTVAEVPS